ncbi:SETMR methyltransferase, partial [Acromyrmex heyeri]
MEKNEFRAVIKHLHMKDLTSKEIKAELDDVHGRPIEAATPEIIDKVHNIVLTDRRMKVRELVKARGISHGTVISILHEQLGMKKLSATWVLRLLIVDHKRDCVTILKQCLEMFQCNPDEFLRRFITVVETWTKEQSKQWTLPSEPAPKKAKYATLLDSFNNSLHLAKKKVLFHQDNARVHTCPVPMAKFNEFHYELLSHPAYSLDLALCDYFLFPNLKKWFGGKRFTTKEQLIAETEAHFEGLDLYIVKKMSYDFILSIDFLTKYKMIMQCKDGIKKAATQRINSLVVIIKKNRDIHLYLDICEINKKMNNNRTATIEEIFHRVGKKNIIQRLM